MPERFGEYELIEKIATGGMAEIYLARTGGVEGFSRPVVVKKMLPQLAVREDFVTMFLDEARLAANLAHANVVQVFNLGEVDGAYFMAMELVDGPHLGALFAHSLRKRNPLPIEMCVHSIARSADGLHYAHNMTDPNTGQRLNIVHRDISPQNILVSRHGDVKVTDFGVAKASTQETKTRTGIIKGKVAYMSPEQCLGELVDSRTDVFALGVVLYELLTRRRLFRDKSDLLIMQRITGQDVAAPSTLNSDVDEELDQICQKALARKREERFESAAELSEALDVWLAMRGYADCRNRLSRWMREHAPDLGLGLGATAVPHADNRTPSGIKELEQGGNTASTPALGEDRVKRDDDDATRIEAMKSGGQIMTADDPENAVARDVAVVPTFADQDPQEDDPSLTHTDPPPEGPATSTDEAPQASDAQQSGASNAASGGDGSDADLEGLAAAAEDEDRRMPAVDPAMLPAKSQGGSKTPILVGGGLALLLAVGVGVAALSNSGDDDETPIPARVEANPATPSPSAAATPEAKSDPVEKAVNRNVAHLKIATDPPGAQLFVDDKPVGQAPFEGNVPSGSRRIGALFGNKMVHRNVMLKATEKKSVRMVAPVPLEVTSSPSSAAVRVDGELVGETPLPSGRSFVEPGERVSIRVSKSGYVSDTVVITPKPGTPAKVSVNLRKIQVASYGTLTVYSKPWSYVYIDGRRIGEVPISSKRVRAGRMNLRFVRDDLGINVTKSVTVPRNGKRQVTATFTKSGGRYRASINVK